MTGDKNRTSPGVYITELDAFPAAVVGVPTSVPAFIGYTEKAQINGKDCFNQPMKVGSMAEFETYFGGRFNPTYNIQQQTNPQNLSYDFKVRYAASTPLVVSAPQVGSYLFYDLKQASASEFYLYDSMRLFYANGGRSCYVVSVGDYRQSASVQKDDLIRGLDVIRQQDEPTMLVVPDAMLLKLSAAYQAVVREMLKQCGDLQDRVAILDVYGTLIVDSSSNLDTVITQFRTDVGNENMSYGMAYFPFLRTSIVAKSDFSYQGLQPLSLLQNILSWENYNLYHANNQSRYMAVQDIINRMVPPQVTADPQTLAQNAASVKMLTQNLTSAIPLLSDILGVIVAKNCMRPPSAAMAGIYTQIDSTRGVWTAPANIALNAVDRTTFKLTDAQQGNLNAPVDGKAVNALREFVGRGNVVWGARTLNGNSSDWRYIPVRRTMIYIEQSIKNALKPFVSAPNNGKTWATVVSMVFDFLKNLWSQGGLMGATASDAFNVQCGLGSTMTASDILDGYMIVRVSLQIIRPGEFLALTFKQKMEGVG